jgi:Putative zinc-finger
MDCRECMENLTAYLDRELSSRHARRVKLHVDRCGPCNQELVSLREAENLITGNIRELTPRSELWDNIRVQISSREMEPRSPGFLEILYAKRWLTAATALAATLLLTLGIWAYLRSLQYDDTLTQYMTEYFEKRQSEERTQLSLTPASLEKSSDNPFVLTPDEDASDNPFRERGR